MAHSCSWEAWVIDAVYILEDGGVGLPEGGPAVPPDELGFGGFEEGFDRCIVVTASLATHGRQHFVGR